MERNQVPKIVKFRPPAGDLQSRIREVAVKDERVCLGTDLKRRLYYDGISRLDVVRMLQNGFVVDHSIESDVVGRWTCQIAGAILGIPTGTLATICFDGTNIFVLKIV